MTWTVLPYFLLSWRTARYIHVFKAWKAPPCATFLDERQHFGRHTQHTDTAGVTPILFRRPKQTQYYIGMLSSTHSCFALQYVTNYLRLKFAIATKKLFIPLKNLPTIHTCTHRTVFGNLRLASRNWVTRIDYCYLEEHCQLQHESAIWLFIPVCKATYDISGMQIVELRMSHTLT